MYIGKYEFLVSPSLLFSFDGKVHLYTDKSKLMHALEDKAQEMEMTDEVESLPESNLNVVIYDGMALVNKLEIGKDVQTCKELIFMKCDLSLVLLKNVDKLLKILYLLLE